MKRFPCTALLMVSALAWSGVPALADYTLHVLHINDWHSRIEPINEFNSSCGIDEDAAGSCFGGAARLATAISARRDELTDANVVFLNAGDNFQGSLFFTTYKGEVEAEFLNHMRPAAMALGNHELSNGEPALAAFLDKAEFPVLAANVQAGEGSLLGDRIRPSIVLELGGERIGIVGAVPNDTDAIAAPGSKILITEDVTAIAAAVRLLQAEGINKIIALTHVGYARDVQEVAKIPGVDIVIGGHSHTLLHDDHPDAAGPYPTWVENPDGYRVPVVHAGAYSKYLGEISVTFNDEGVVQNASGAPILLDHNFTPDPAIKARIRELLEPVEAVKLRPVSEATAPIEGSREACRARECELGNLVTDAMLDRYRDRGVEIVLINGGSLRNSIAAGEITMGQIIEALPFGNTVSTLQLQGSDIIAALENGVSEFESGAGRFPQVAGIRYAFDPSQPPGKGRIVRVDVRTDEGWQPIVPERSYGVATNDFLRKGSDGYTMLRDDAVDVFDFGPGIDEIVAEYLGTNRPYQPHLDGRIARASTIPRASTEAE